MTAIRDIQHHVGLLRDGWTERIEYRVRINGQLESRATSIRMPGLLAQLQAYATGDGDPGADDGTQRRPPNTGGSRPPGRVGGLMLHDEIVCEANTWLDTLGFTGRANDPLAVLLGETERLADSRPGTVSDIADRAREWVRLARRFLAHDDGQAMFADTVCGDCGGALAVGRDAARATAVRCVGSPAAPACGRRYDRGEWLTMLAVANGITRTAPVTVDTATAVRLLAQPGASKASHTALRRMIYNRAREGAITRHGKPGRGQARWDADEIRALAVDS